MSLPVQRWYSAIPSRHSVRRYSGEQVPEEILDELDRVVTGFRPFRGARAILVRRPTMKFVRRFVGVLDKSGVVHYVAFLGDTTDDHAQEVAGYIGEGVVLEATALGLNTCWVAALLRKENIAREVGATPDEEVLAITPIGYAENIAERLDDHGIKTVRPHRRKDVAELIYSGEKTGAEWVHRAIEAARLAPSAVNRQPWRFSIGTNSITISAAPTRYDFGVSPRLDCGIAALHLHLGALSAGVECTLDLLDPPDVARLSIK
ncbi:MAG: nitroreductase family protein [Candidatus Thorarchaeota archaeon]